MLETEAKDHTSSSAGSLDFFGSPGPNILDSEETGKHARRRMVEGELSLLLAVLQDSVDCYLKHIAAKDRLGKRKFEEAEEWIFGDQDGDWLFAFKNICELLGIAPTYVRQGLLERKKKAEVHTRGSSESILERKSA